MGPQLAAYACVALGSALGGVARYWMGLAVTHRLGDGFPWGTLFINILGSFVIAFFGTLTIADGPRPASVEARLFVMVGLCGGFTTFSSFSLQTFDLVQAGEAGRGIAYIAASVALCIIGTALGYYAAAAINARS